MSPISEYVCENCHHWEEYYLTRYEFDALGPYIECPKCHGLFRRVLNATNFQVKGHSSKNNYSHRPEVPE